MSELYVSVYKPTPDPAAVCDQPIDANRRHPELVILKNPHYY